MPLQVWYQPQTADVGLLLGTLSGAVIDYLNNNGEERLLKLIIVAGRKEHCNNAIKSLFSILCSQETITRFCLYLLSTFEK